MFEHISTSGKEKTVSLPPRLRKFETGAAELLARSEEMLGRAAGSLGAGEEEKEHSYEFGLPARGLTRGKRKLLDAMRELSAAEDHLVNKYPELAGEIRQYRKKVEAVVL